MWTKTASDPNGTVFNRKKHILFMLQWDNIDSLFQTASPPEFNNTVGEYKISKFNRLGIQENTNFYTNNKNTKKELLQIVSLTYLEAHSSETPPPPNLCDKLTLTSPCLSSKVTALSQRDFRSSLPPSRSVTVCPPCSPFLDCLSVCLSVCLVCLDNATAR